MNEQIYLRECSELRAKIEAREATLSMAVARLGGEVEGAPTHRFNFLKRIDSLVEIERGMQRICDVAAANLVRAEQAEAREATLRAALQRNIKDADRRDRASDDLLLVIRTTAVDALRVGD